MSAQRAALPMGCRT